MERIYKADNFINDIAFGASVFIFCDLNTYFQLKFAVNFSRDQSFFCKLSKNYEVAHLTNFQFFILQNQKMIETNGFQILNADILTIIYG